MTRIFDQIMDGLDIETFVVCNNDQEGRKLVTELLKEYGFTYVGIVFSQFQGPGARIRARAYIHRSGDVYGWLNDSQGELKHHEKSTDSTDPIGPRA